MTGAPSRKLRIHEFCKQFGLSRSKFYEMVADGVFTLRKSGPQHNCPSLVDEAEGERWFNSLPISTAGRKKEAA